MEYNSLNNLNDSDRASLHSVFQGILSNIKHNSINKAINYIRYLASYETLAEGLF